MLEHTFLHLPHIGRRTEIDLWRQGVITWDDLELHLREWPKSPERRWRIADSVQESKENRGQARYFHDRLPPAERWRLYGDFRHRCAFLDIETTGLSSECHEITVIGIYDGLETHHFINGENLEKFEHSIDAYELLITFNGSSFDLPFITRFFHNHRFRQAHIDLRHVIRRLGYRGGLKSIEPFFGIYRSAEIQEMSGYEAVVLWHKHLQGDPGALPKLLLYNQADVINLKTIMEMAWERLLGNLELEACRPLPCQRQMRREKNAKSVVRI